MKINNILTTALLIAILLIGMPGVLADTTGVFDQNTNITTTNGNITAAQIAQIQPGLGTVMREYGYRFWGMFYAAKNGNWDLAQYELKEAREIQEVGEITRPGRAAMLKAFELAYLNPLQDAMNTTDLNTFQNAYNNAKDGCNACHVANGFSYIKYTLPSHPPDFLFAHTTPTTGRQPVIIMPTDGPNVDSVSKTLLPPAGSDAASSIGLGVQYSSFVAGNPYSQSVTDSNGVIVPGTTSSGGLPTGHDFVPIHWTPGIADIGNKFTVHAEGRTTDGLRITVDTETAPAQPVPVEAGVLGGFVATAGLLSRRLKKKK